MKAIENFEGYFITEDGQVYSSKTKKWLRQYDNKSGYKFICMWNNGRKINRYVHRLVAQSFIPNEENKSDVNHIDGDKGNNNLSNLEWTSRSENIKHAHVTGLMNQSRKGMKIMSEEQAREILSLEGKMSRVKISKKFGVGVSTVADIHLRNTWKHIS